MEKVGFLFMTVYLICCCSVANGGSNAAGDAAAETSDGKCVRYKARYTPFLFCSENDINF